jgi:hypothetical protein
MKMASDNQSHQLDSGGTKEVGEARQFLQRGYTSQPREFLRDDPPI